MPLSPALQRGQKALTLLSRLIAGVVLAGVIYVGWKSTENQRTLQSLQAQERAIAALQQQTQATPKDPQAFLQLGNANLSLWKAAGAGIKIASQRNDVTLFSEWVTTRSQALQAAISAYQTATDLAPQSSDAHAGLCQAFATQPPQQAELLNCRVPR